MTSADTGQATGLKQVKGFRPDVEGLRAVAIGLVLIYHAGVSLVPGGFVGVDVFFVLSGFLITGLLIRELEKTGRISLPRFYARRARRLLPAVGVVLVVTAFLTWWTSSVIDWRPFGLDIVAAAAYVVNWRLADRSVDYLAEDVGVSPVQHFWSLAVEEQFYVVWPLLLLLIAWVVRTRKGARLRPVMTVGILLVIVPSLAWSIHYTETNSAQAFFVTTTRLWELGVGALVAIGATVWPKIPRAVAIVVGWAGLVAVAASGLILTENAVWPGSAALWPTLATAAVIIAGYNAGKAGPIALLGIRPAVWIGGLSYSLYLWHWPLLIAATGLWGELGAKRGLLVVAFAFIPAYLSYRFVENPIRFAPTLGRSNRLTYSVAANFTLAGVAAGLIVVLAIPSTTGPVDDAQAQGAAAVQLDDRAVARSGYRGPGSVASLDEVKEFTPAAIAAVEDVPEGPKGKCQVDQVSSEPIVCEYGDLDGDVTIAALGDSKLLQWWSALDKIAKDEGWHLVSMTKSACAFGQAMQLNKGEFYTSCTEWNDNVMKDVLDLDPDVALVSSRVATALPPGTEGGNDDRTKQAMEDGLVEAWQTLAHDDIPVVALLDNPGPGHMKVYECVAENPTNLEKCTFDRAEGTERSGASVQVPAAERVPGTQTVDMADAICPTETCVPIIGNVLVFRQTSHITDTYARTLTPELARRLIPAIDTALDQSS